MKRTVFVPLLALALACAVAGAQTLQIKIATVAPENSPWATGLRKLAADWERVASGRITVKLYLGTPGDEADILQKMRFGLDAGVLSSTSIARITEDVMALSLPGLLVDDASIERGLAAARPILEREIAKEGLVVVAWTKAGWARIFSRRPIPSVAAFKGLRFAVPSDDSNLTPILQGLGAVPIRTETGAVIQRLTTGAIDAMIYSPLLVSAQWSFFRSSIAAVSDEPVAPVFGALVVTKKTWDKVPAELKPALIAAAEAAAAEISRESDRYEELGIAAMVRDGLARTKLDAAAAAEWRRTFAATRDRYAPTLFSKEIVDALLRAAGTSAP
ncbi:MAG: TRAP transporter substrate-binding protein DctP [Spirochaetia bacterium]|nr:TRAP transporter substrate-binding protein DctP [Spirochaetia bacterium]